MQGQHIAFVCPPSSELICAGC